MSDSISRQAAIDVIHDAYENQSEFMIPNMIKGIKSLPSTNRQNINKGEWVRETDATSPENSILYKCSVCGNTHSNIYKRGKIHGEWSDNVLIEKFCNNCGADMRGGIE